MNQIKLYDLKLKTFTEQDALDYCQLNNIDIKNIIELDLSHNELTDITGIKLFKNLETLWLYENNLTYIYVLKDLNKLKTLNISYNKLTDISVLKDLTKLENLWLHNNKIINISEVKNLINLKDLSIYNLELESDQIEYINSLKKLNTLFCKNGFKDMSVLNQLNKNIIIE